MSWDKVNFIEVAPCACGNGRVKRLGYTECDDWNRSRDDIVSEVIECENCCKQYRIKHIIKHYLCLSSDGDGVVDKAYLVPNSLEIPKQLEEKTFNFSVPEQIVAKYCLSDILAVRADMLKNKYCTRLKLKNSQGIVSIYKKRYKKRGIKSIVEMLDNIEHHYDKYEWTQDKLTEYREKEKALIEENKKEIAAVLNQSVLLEFRRGSNDKT